MCVLQMTSSDQVPAESEKVACDSGGRGCISMCLCIEVGASKDGSFSLGPVQGRGSLPWQLDRKVGARGRRAGPLERLGKL